MAVQAQSHPAALIDLRKRAFAMEDKTLATPVLLFTDERDPTIGFPSFHAGLNASHPKMVSDVETMGARKRRKRAAENVKTQRFSFTSAMDVSSRIMLAFGDDPLKVTLPSDSSLLFQDLLSQHQKDLGKIFNNQMNNLRQVLEERRQIQTKALFGAMEETMKKKLRDKELALEALKRRTTELEEKARYLGMESQLWQSKAQSNEAMVAVLRANVQQAMAHCISKEGCGESDADDAASVVHAGEFHEARCFGERTLRICKLCNAKETTVVLVPCFHLCVCMDCAACVSRCPVCGIQTTATVRVYLT